jgi:hypothetical protein
MNPLEAYLKEMRDIRATGAAVAETSFYPALSTLLNTIGKTLKPKVRCVINLANRGAGLPDGGLFTPDQFQRASAAAPRPGQLPARGVMEVKSPAEDVRSVAAALNRVQRATFFQKFQGEHAVQYFYEPFLEQFDPELRKQPALDDNYRRAAKSAYAWPRPADAGAKV